MKRLILWMVVGNLLVGASLAWGGTAKDKLAQLSNEVDGMEAVIPADITGKEKAKMEAQFKRLQKFVKEKLISTLNDKVWVEEVTKQNAKKVSLDEIKRIDKRIAAEEESPIHVEKLNNACAKEVKKICKSLPELGEVFVMDNQGANVGQNDLTSDYWQGDEAKWQKSFKDGKGGAYISLRKYDRSSGIADRKVALPIVNDDGQVIGAVSFGVKVDKL